MVHYTCQIFFFKEHSLEILEFDYDMLQVIIVLLLVNVSVSG